MPAQEHHRYTSSPSQTDLPRCFLVIPLKPTPSFRALSPRNDEGGRLSYQAYKETNREYLANSQEEGSRRNLEPP